MTGRYFFRFLSAVGSKLFHVFFSLSSSLFLHFVMIVTVHLSNLSLEFFFLFHPVLIHISLNLSLPLQSESKFFILILWKYFTLVLLLVIQHGFREKRSCESQLLMLVDDLLKSLNLKKQTDLILLDFSKAFWQG